MDTRRTTGAVDLDALAAHAQRALEPVTPSAKFRARLRDGLRVAAHQREAPHLLVRPRAKTPWALLAGVALGSAAGLVAILLRARQGAHGAEQVAEAKSSKVA
ncbi:MAG: hypothetical protein FJ009_19350 [Chloroflexi bacterium]|nr:hypothetical protein [Chloroflexota bacterium]